jgi:hypothetical protein
MQKTASAIADGCLRSILGKGPSLERKKSLKMSQQLAQILAGASVFGANTSRSAGPEAGLKIAIKLVRRWIVPRMHLYKELPAAARFTRKMMCRLKKARLASSPLSVIDLGKDLPFIFEFLKIAEHDPQRVIGPYYELVNFVAPDPIDLTPYLRVRVPGRGYWWVGADTPEQLAPLRSLLQVERLSEVVQQCCLDLAKDNPTKALDDHMIVQAGSTAEGHMVMVVMRTTLSNLLKEVQARVCVLEEPDAPKELQEDLLAESKLREREELNYQAGLRSEN